MSSYWMLLAQASPDPSNTWAQDFVNSIRAQTQNLTSMFESGLMPTMRSMGLTIAILGFAVNLGRSGFSYFTGDGRPTNMNMVTNAFRFLVILVLLTGGGTASSVGLPKTANDSAVVTLGANGVAPGDTYTSIAWAINDFSDGLLTGLSNGAMKALFEGRSKFVVAVVKPPESLTSPPKQSASTPSDGSTSTTFDPNSTSGNSGSLQNPVPPEAANKSGPVDGLWNWATNGFVSGVLTLVQLAAGPVVFAFMCLTMLIQLLLWSLGPLTVGLIMIDMKWFKDWVEKYVQVSLWPLITQILLSLISFMKAGVSLDPNNPAAAWVAFAYSILIFVGLWFVPAIAAFGQGLVTQAGAAFGGMLSGAGTSAGRLTSAGIKKGNDDITKAAGGRYMQKQEAGYSREMKNDLASSADPSGSATGRAYMNAVARGGFTGSADDWIAAKSKSSAINDLRNAQVEARAGGSGPLSGAGKAGFVGESVVEAAKLVGGAALNAGSMLVKGQVM
jgi:hypothetical protein